MDAICPILNRRVTTESTPYRRDTWEIVRCRETGFVFLANPPKYEQLEEQFAWEKTYHAEMQHRRESEPVIAVASDVAKAVKFTISPMRNRMADLAVKTMSSFSSDTLKLLDIGCGDGGLMVQLQQRFSQRGKKVIPFGIEVSEELSKVSREKVLPLGGDVVKKYAIAGCEQLVGHKFDLVVMSCFLEHEAQPLLLLQNVFQILADQGCIVIKVPNFASWNRHVRGKRWCGFRYPDHVNYFTPATLKRLAKEAGFTRFRQSICDKVPVSDNMYCVLSK
ncbi:MAG: hypothetical protein RLY14_108 [Planctomycetota bacterium]|jgi:2-polyprenyl-3-methyl-5-hydroxy-6-metoxy-1,4-benzoquinol methylase